MDTRNILFICGGAFEGLEKVVQKRVDKSTLGFDFKAPKKKEQTSEYLRLVNPDDLMKYGLIPEFIGRLPIIRSLDNLDETAMGGCSYGCQAALAGRFSADADVSARKTSRATYRLRQRMISGLVSPWAVRRAM